MRQRRFFAANAALFLLLLFPAPPGYTVEAHAAELPQGISATLDGRWLPCADPVRGYYLQIDMQTRKVLFRFGARASGHIAGIRDAVRHGDSYTLQLDLLTGHQSGRHMSLVISILREDRAEASFDNGPPSLICRERPRNPLRQPPANSRAPLLRTDAPADHFSNEMSDSVFALPQVFAFEHLHGA